MAVGAGQIWMIRKQANIAEQQNAIIFTQNSIMDGQRKAAEIQSTYMLQGLDAAKTSAEAARDAVLLAHRPRLTVRAVSATFAGNQVHSGCARMVNFGTSVATLKGLSSRWLIAERLPMSNPLDAEKSHGIKDHGLPPGAFVLSELPDITLSTGDDIHFADENDKWSLFLVGVVKYVDAIGFWRRTGFCRRYDRTEGRFVVVENPNHEYEE